MSSSAYESREIRNFSQKVRAARLEASLTQGDLASGLGVTVQEISRWENAHSFPGFSNLLELSRILERELVWFFEEETACVQDARRETSSVTPLYADSLAKTLDSLSSAADEIARLARSLREAN